MLAHSVVAVVPVVTWLGALVFQQGLGTQLPLVLVGRQQEIRPSPAYPAMMVQALQHSPLAQQVVAVVARLMLLVDQEGQAVAPGAQEQLVVLAHRGKAIPVVTGTHPEVMLLAAVVAGLVAPEQAGLVQVVAMAAMVLIGNLLALIMQVALAAWKKTARSLPVLVGLAAAVEVVAATLEDLLLVVLIPVAEAVVAAHKMVALVSSLFATLTHIPVPLQQQVLQQ